MNDAPHERTESGSAAASLPPYPWVPAPDPGPGLPDDEESWPVPGSADASLPEALEAALAGTGLAGRDRQFLDRLVKWDKRNAAPVVSLMWKARFAGRAETAMKPQELEIIIGALRDAARYRDSGADTLGCWDCDNMPGGRCQEHSKDFDKAQACSELAAALTAARAARGKAAAGKATTAPGVPQQQRGDTGYVRPVAS